MPAGRPRNIESPELLWLLFQKYAAKEKASPRFKTEYVGKDGVMVKTPLEVPLTLEGFRCDIWEEYGDTMEYFRGTYPEFSQVCSRIRESVRRDQIGGGMVGQYNASITQRLNGLTDKQQIEVKAEQPLFGPTNV